MMERGWTERELGHIVWEGEGIFDVIVLVANRRSRFGGAERGDCSDLDGRYPFFVFVFDGFGGMDWRTDVNDGGRLLGDAGAGDEAVDNGLHLGPSRLAKIHFDTPAGIVEFIVSVRRLGDTMDCLIFRKVEVGIGPFFPGLGWCGNSDHVGE